MKTFTLALLGLLAFVAAIEARPNDFRRMRDVNGIGKGKGSGSGSMDEQNRMGEDGPSSVKRGKKGASTDEDDVPDEGENRVPDASGSGADSGKAGRVGKGGSVEEDEGENRLSSGSGSGVNRQGENEDGKKGERKEKKGKGSALYDPAQAGQGGVVALSVGAVCAVVGAIIVTYRKATQHVVLDTEVSEAPTEHTPFLVTED
eukprot:m.39078 g.39078  ORF g.39078 m.39078 type:complete len:203 (-) comp7909_c0_seq1:144-752(-)